MHGKECMTATTRQPPRPRPRPLPVIHWAALLSLCSWASGVANVVILGEFFWMSRFCLICRGEDDVFRCSGCRQAFHAECVSRRSKPTKADRWLCSDCEEAAANGETRSRAPPCGRARAVREWHERLMRARAAFIASHRHLLVPFCNDHVLDQCTKTRPRARESEAVRDALPPLSGSPHYIQAELRPYQVSFAGREGERAGRGRTTIVL